MRSMTRGKQQVLYNYLPGRTFDFEKVDVIARVDVIRGTAVNDLNTFMVLLKVTEQARAWQSDMRPVLRDDVLREPSRFVLVDPEEVRSSLFPNVFWCQNRSCGVVVDRTGRALPQTNRCQVCRSGKLLQIRFVKVHRCGAIAPLIPPACRRCGNNLRMALDTRGSERLSNFRWVCRSPSCGAAQTLFSGRCNACQWPGNDPRLRNMDVEVHRAGRTFYAHSAVLLNTPNRELNSFLSVTGWQYVAAAKYLGLPGVANRALSSFSPSTAATGGNDATLSGAEVESLLARQANNELSPEQMAQELTNLLQRRRREQTAGNPVTITQDLVGASGVRAPVWEEAGQEMLEALLPFEIGRPVGLSDGGAPAGARAVATRLRLENVFLYSDFPIVTATYGFSRTAYTPNDCRLNAFPSDPNFSGRLPIFVDRIQADAISVRLDPESVLQWLSANGLAPVIPAGTNPSMSAKSYFAQLFAGANLRETIRDNNELRLVFGLLHSLAHLCVRQAAVLCGLDMTSISEYILPRALTVSIYCNHRFGATIGALTALYEQSFTDWLRSVQSQAQCIYDPVCRDRDGACHACAYLAETSCRYFNLNLNRAFLFGGTDPVLQRRLVGYWEGLSV